MCVLLQGFRQAAADAGVITVAIHKRAYKKLWKILDFGISSKNKRLFFVFLRYGSWRPLDVTKTMSEDVQTFSTIGNLILRTSFLGRFYTHPPSTVAAELSDTRVIGYGSMVSSNPEFSTHSHQRMLGTWS